MRVQHTQSRTLHVTVTVSNSFHCGRVDLRRRTWKIVCDACPAQRVLRHRGEQIPYCRGCKTVEPDGGMHGVRGHDLPVRRRRAVLLVCGTQTEHRQRVLAGWQAYDAHSDRHIADRQVNLRRTLIYEKDIRSHSGVFEAFCRFLLYVFSNLYSILNIIL